jgi:hypothetical protein
MFAMFVTNPTKAGTRPPAPGLALGDDVDAIARLRSDFEAVCVLLIVGEHGRMAGTTEDDALLDHGFYIDTALSLPPEQRIQYNSKACCGVRKACHRLLFV